ncbi:MAG: glycosyltransferase family 4 protein [Thermoanaerobaculum sp.]|nr:glycosyltransferase family 4 protein [Thermoanaerobaculum sp.]
MRIAFDARPLVGPRTGVGVWLEGLLQQLVNTTPFQAELHLPRREEPHLPPPLASLSQLAPPVPLPGTLWLLTYAATQVAGATLFVGTLGVLPRRLPVPAILTLHDLTPWTRPHQHRLLNRFCFNAYVEESLAQAEVVVCDSHATAHRLARLLPGRARRVKVIPLAVDEFFSPGPEDPVQVRGRFAQGRPFIVQLGTLEPRKGVATLIAAHDLLLASHPQAPDLVLAGGRGWGGAFLSRALRRHRYPQRVHLPGYVSRQEARSLLRCAEVVVLASEEEGFGLPLAEALCCGAACVASDEEALVEVAAGAALHAPRGDAQALAQILQQALQPQARQALQEQARRRAPQLRWQRVWPEWLQLLLEVAEGGG